MNITAEELYWLTRLDYLRIACGASLVIAGITWFAICSHLAENDNTFGVTVTTILEAIIALGLICGLVFIPTTKEMAVIKVVPAIVNSDFVQKDVPADAKQIYELGKKAAIEYLEGKK